jgi:hypothetical protein
MNPLDNNKDCEFAKYFKNLGYDYSWDFDRQYRWHELYKDRKLVLQVEMVPLEKIIRDMVIIEEIVVDYFIAGHPENKHLYDELCEKVREFEKSKV